MRKLNLVIATLVLGTTSALAQQKTYNLQVNESDLGVIAKTLGKAPYEEAVPVFQKLQGQINAQTAPKPEASTPTTTPNPTDGPATAVPSAKAGPSVDPKMEAMERDLKAKGKAKPSALPAVPAPAVAPAGK